jgi:hypothetical protein
MIRILRVGLRLIAALTPWLATATALGQGDEDGAFDRTPQDCVLVSRIDQTEALDDQNIIFRMRGNEVYRNTLPRKCPGLERENRISYVARGGRLCSIDTISVLEDFGFGLRPGFTCRLGEFVPLSPDELEDLEFRENEQQGGQSAIETSTIEVEGDDAATEPEQDAAPPAGESAGVDEDEDED